MKKRHIERTFNDYDDGRDDVHNPPLPNTANPPPFVCLMEFKMIKKMKLGTVWVKAFLLKNVLPSRAELCQTDIGRWVSEISFPLSFFVKKIGRIQLNFMLLGMRDWYCACTQVIRITR